jgi:hypothetical protein
MAYNPDTLSFTVPDVDMIYVAGLPPGITEEAMAAHFGTIGVLKQDKKKGKPKIWLYRDKATGALKARPSAGPASSQSRASRLVAWGSACARLPFSIAALSCTVSPGVPRWLGFQRTACRVMGAAQSPRTCALAVPGLVQYQFVTLDIAAPSGTWTFLCPARGSRR